MSESQHRRSDRGYFVSVIPQYISLLKDDAVKRWVANLKKKAGWRTTVPGFLRILHKFANYTDKKPEEMVVMAAKTIEAGPEEKSTLPTSEITQLSKVFISRLLDSGKRESARRARTCLVSFFRANGLSLELENIPRVPKRGELVLKKRQIYAMADYATSLRNRAIILYMYHSGLGIIALRNLNYGHVKKQLEKNRVPVRIHITSHISKRALQVPYYAFFGEEACEALKAYINERKRKFQVIVEQADERENRSFDVNSALFASEGRNVTFGERMAISSIWRVITDAAERTGLEKGKFRPGFLRKAFELELDRAPIDEQTRNYLKGKKNHGMKYNIQEVERQYMEINFSRTELNKLGIIKEFVQSIGITEINREIQTVLRNQPEMTEMDALIFLMRLRVKHSCKK